MEDAPEEVALAIDIGGTKLAVALVDGAGGLVWSARAPTPQVEAGPAVWDALARLVASVPDEPAPRACGVGCGGPMTRGGERVTPLNIASWRDFPLRARVGELTGLPTWVDNDAKALALAEGWVGAARGQCCYLAMVVSTGVGGGLVVDGRLLEGNGGNAGHIGHVIVNPDGRRCSCGARGCLEAEASGTAIAALSGAPAAAAGPALIERTGRMVGRGVASVANLIDLRCVVVSGSVALGFGEPFFTAARAELDRCARLDFSAGCAIVPSLLGAEGPLIGAAALAWKGLRGRGAAGVGQDGAAGVGQDGAAGVGQDGAAGVGGVGQK